MKLYSCHFVGHYPVGAVAIVTAESKEEGAVLLMQRLKDEDLAQTIEPCELDEIDVSTAKALILCDGNY